MSPAQYRALERLAEGPARLTFDGHQRSGRIHPATAAALERRGLAAVEDSPSGLFAVITSDGFGLLHNNPEPIDAASSSKRPSV